MGSNNSKTSNSQQLDTIKQHIQTLGNQSSKKDKNTPVNLFLSESKLRSIKGASISPNFINNPASSDRKE